MSGEARKTEFRKALLEYSILALLITAVWSISCAVKGIYPFGGRLLEFGDMIGQYVPMYIHLWDVLHGAKSLWFDWYTGLGNNMAGATLHFGLISPFNLFFLFIDRGSVEPLMSVYILIKLVAIGCSIRFVLHKWFPGFPMLLRMAFSLLYVFSVFNMQYYYAVMWLDVSFLFPLVMYAFFLLMDEGRCLPYILLISLACMMNFQHSCMILLMLLFLAGLLPLTAKERYQGRLPALLLSTVLAIMLSAWIYLPGSLQILQSSRLDSGIDLVGIWRSVWVFFTAKWMKLLNTGIPLALFFLYLVRYRRQKASRFLAAVLAILGAPILLESTNLLWHGGSYQGYTMRFAYMLTFWILTAGAYAYCNGALSQENTISKRSTVLFGSFGFILMTTVTAVQFLLLKSADMSVHKEEIPAVYVIAIVVLGVAAGCGLLCYERHIYEKAVFCLVIMQIVTIPVNTVIPCDAKGDTYIADCVLMEAEKRQATQNPLYRTKSIDPGLDHNYPLIAGKYSASDYLVADSQRKMAGLKYLGYASVGYRMSDYGGTLFSDALLGYHEVIDSQGADGDLYQYEKSYGKYSTYQCLYTYDQGILLHDADCVPDGDNDPFTMQNRMAEAVWGGEYVPLRGIEEVTPSGGHVDIEDKSVLYFYSPQCRSIRNITVTDDYSGQVQRLQPSESGWIDGILELGVWEDASLTIEISAEEPVQQILCAVLPIQEFVEHPPVYADHYMSEADDNSIKISLDNADAGKFLFLPIYHETGWSCSVNGSKIEPEELGDYFLTVPLEDGHNDIALAYTPPGRWPGLVLSVLGVLLTGIVAFSKNIADAIGSGRFRPAGRILFFLDEMLFGVLMAVFYLIPLLFLVIETVKSLIT